MLKVTDLSFSYGRTLPGIKGKQKQILSHISFELGPGQCLVVAGPNGCGKSTLLSILSGGLPGAAGSVRTDGETIGLVPQGFGVFEDMTVLENIRFFARLQKKKVPRPLPFGLEAYAGTKARVLSGGFKKRLCIACTAVSDPDIWLFDEPCANLDIVWRDEIIRMVCDLKRAGKSIIYTGHDPSEFISFYDGILFIKNGTGCLVNASGVTPGQEEALIRSHIG